MVPGGAVKGVGERGRLPGDADRAAGRRSRALPPGDGVEARPLGEQRSPQHRRLLVQHPAERAAAVRPVSRAPAAHPGEARVRHPHLQAVRPAVPGLRGPEALLPAAHESAAEAASAAAALQQYYR